MCINIYSHKYKPFDHIIIWVYVFRSDRLTPESHLLLSFLEMTLPLTILYIAYYFLCKVEVSWNFFCPLWDCISASSVSLHLESHGGELLVCRF